MTSRIASVLVGSHVASYFAKCDQQIFVLRPGVLCARCMYVCKVLRDTTSIPNAGLFFYCC